MRPKRTSLLNGCLFLLLLVIVALSFRARTTHAQAATCPDGTSAHLARPQEASSVEGITVGVTYVCPADAALGISNTVGSAKDYLKKLPRTGSAATDSNVDQLNNTFAVCATNFFKEYQQRYGGVTLTSAYRSPEYDAKMCINNSGCGALMNNPNPMGNHQRGLAIDVKAASGNQQTLWDFAQQNPQFGVCFPFTSGRFIDTVHMILIGGPGSESSGLGCRGVTKPCSGAPPLNIVTPFPSAFGPSTPFSNDLRSLLGMQPPSPPPPMQQFPSAQQQFSSAPQQITMSAAPVATPIGTTNTVPNVSTGGTASQPPVSDYLSSFTNANTNSNTNSTSSVSAIDQISALANPQSSSVPIGTPVSIALNESLGQSSGISSDQSGNSGTQVNGTTGSLAQVQTSPSQQTFVSNDLSNSPVNSTYAPPGSLTPLETIWLNIRNTLTNILHLLQPFGGRVISTDF